MGKLGAVRVLCDSCGCTVPIERYKKTHEGLAECEVNAAYKLGRDTGWVRAGLQSAVCKRAGVGEVHPTRLEVDKCLPPLEGLAKARAVRGLWVPGYVRELACRLAWSDVYQLMSSVAVYPANTYRDEGSVRDQFRGVLVDVRRKEQSYYVPPNNGGSGYPKSGAPQHGEWKKHRVEIRSTAMSFRARVIRSAFDNEVVRELVDPSRSQEDFMEVLRMFVDQVRDGMRKE